MKLKFIAGAALSCVLTATSVGAQSQGAVVAFKGATIFDGTGAAAVANSTLIVKGDRVVAVGGPTLAIPADAQVVELGGKTIIPGLISNHSHIGIVEGVTSRPENFNKDFILTQLKQWEAFGVTTVTSLGMNGPLVYELRNGLHAGKLPGADLYTADRGIGVEAGAPPATIVKVSQDQIYRPNSVEEARTAVREMADRQADLIKVWLDDFGKSVPTKVLPDIYRSVVEESHKRGLRVAAHIHDIDDAKSILRVGGDIVAHGVRDQAVDGDFIQLMKDRNAWYIPTLALDDSNFVYAERPDLVSAPTTTAWLHPAVKALWNDPAWQTRVRTSVATQRAKRDLATNQVNLLTLYKAGIPIGFGSDSGVGMRIPGVAEHRELVLMVESGLTPTQALTIATSNAARLLKLNDRGTLQAGMLADFVVLGADPTQNINDIAKVEAVWHRGQRVAGALERGPASP